MDLIYYILFALGIIVTGYIILPVRRIFKKNRLIKAQAREIAAKNETLKEQNEQLERMNKEKNQIISFVSHDLKAPLNRVFALTNLVTLDNDNLTDEQKEYLKRVQIVVADGLGLIRNMLDIRAIEAKGIMMNPRELSVSSLMQKLIRNFGQAAGRKGITIEFKENTEDLKIRSDQQYVERIYDNILSNSIKFSPMGSSVKVDLGYGENAVVARFIDDGPGIPVDEMDRLFTKFEVLSSKPTGGESSNGLGLSIAKYLAERLGGSITVRNTEDRGAEFTVKLPREFPEAG